MAVTIRQIADELGFSPATVSLAIRNKDAGKKKLSKETVNIIQKTAVKMGYRPNILATSLINSMSTSIGVLLGSLSFDSESLIDGLKMSFGEDYSSFLSVYNCDGLRERKELDKLIGHRICGLIAAFSGNSENVSLYEDAVVKYKIPTVAIERSIPGLDIPVVRSDHFNSTYLATKSLLELGHVNIISSGVSFSEHSEIKHLHLKGYHKAMHEAGLGDRVKIFERIGIRDWYKGRNLWRLACEIIDMWVEDGRKATALMLDNDWLAYEVLSECSCRSINIPDELSLIGIGDYMFSSFPYVGLSTVSSAGDYPMQTMIGREAAKLLMDMITGKKWDGKNVVLPVKVNLRKTTRKI